MGQSTNGLLMYGYDLGGGDGEWKVEGLGEYGELERPWMREDCDLEEDIMRVLLATVGYVKPAEYVPGEYQREADAQKLLGVELESYCSGDYPMYALVTKVHTAHRGDCDEVDLTVDPEWRSRLDAALQALDLKPTQAEPTWLLASYWG